MSTGDVARSSRPVRWGLAVKLFAILLLLGAIAVLLTSVMGYLRARDALQEAIYNQLTTARKSKARQVETYFRTLRQELGHLASTQMVVDAVRGFNAGFDALEKTEVSPELTRKVDDWYASQFAPQLRRILGKEPDIKQYLPDGNAAYYLQYRDRRRGLIGLGYPFHKGFWCLATG